MISKLYNLYHRFLELAKFIQKQVFRFSSIMSRLLLLSLLLATFSLALASDPSPLQDFCVADQNSTGKKL